MFRWAPALALFLPLSLSAQSPSDQGMLETFRDSLAGAADSGTLRRLEGATIAVAKQAREDPLVHLRLGFIAYRLGEVTKAKSHFDDAAGEFEWASELRPDWPYPWYGLGLSELALGEHTAIAVENLRQQLGLDHLSKAARAFARAAAADPGFAAAVIDLANTALAQRIRPRLQVALEAVRLAAASPAGRRPELQLARGRIERESGEADSAIAGFQNYLAVGGDSGVGLLELARTYYFARRPALGWRAYFAGARAAVTPAALALYHGDLSWIADSGELAAFDELPAGAPRAEWLERFWTRRDVAEARDMGERLAEHYRRWFYARRSFRLVSPHRHYDITEVYRPAQAEFDDRGVIYMRHGEPDRRAQFARQALEPNESWLYRRPPPAGDLVFHFVARDDAQDFKLVESLVDVLGFSAAVRAAATVDPRVADLYGSRDQFGPLFARISRAQRAPGVELAEDRRRGRHSIAVGTTTDSYAQRFTSPLDVVASEFVVGVDGGQGGQGQALHVVFAIPADHLDPTAGPDGVLYPLRFRLLVADASDGQIARLDTTRVFGAREPLPHGSYLTGRLAVPVPSGRYRYRLLVATADGSAGDLVTQDSVAVDTLDGRRFAASDVVLGRRGSGLTWSLGGDTVFLNPLYRFPRDGAAELYYEVYGLPRGALYHTVVRLEREGGRSLLGAIAAWFGGRRAPVLLEFDAAADGPATRVHRTLELRDVAPGAYALTLRVTDPASGIALTRTQRFQVVSR